MKSKDMEKYREYIESQFWVSSMDLPKGAKSRATPKNNRRMELPLCQIIREILLDLEKHN